MSRIMMMGMFSPLSIPGGAFGLSASRGIGYIQDGEVKYVNQGADLWGNGRNVSQSIPSGRPVLVADAINGRPAIRFSGNAQWLAWSVPWGDGIAQWTLFAVLRQSGTQDWRQVAEASGSKIYMNAQCPRFWPNHTLEWSTAVPDWAIVRWRWSATECAISVNGAPEQVAVSTTNMTTWAWISRPDSYAFNGDIAEFWLWPRFLLQSEWSCLNNLWSSSSQYDIPLVV